MTALFGVICPSDPLLGIENAYSAWLSNLTEEFPDAQLETGCRTLANLVMENDPNNMRKFGVCLLPCMQVGF